MGYFAFVRRDAARRYHASIPDFPGLEVEAERLDLLGTAVRDAIIRQARVDGWPAPTGLEALPRQPDDHDGFWLMVET